MQKFIDWRRFRRAKHFLRQVAVLYRKQRIKLTSDEQRDIETAIDRLQSTIINHDKEALKPDVDNLYRLKKASLKKTSFQIGRDFLIALIIALEIAFLIRQMWFEFYQIPSGSMRPTLQEKDRLVVKKTQFGLNVPFSTKHFFFNADLVDHNQIVVFTGAGMDIPDVNMRYFYIFPGKKQMVKRMIGKPGDNLYFYGGKIYGVDKEGNDITDKLNLLELEAIDHIPFITFSGKVSAQKPASHDIYQKVFLQQMNQPVALLYFNDKQQIKGEMLPIPEVHHEDSSPITEYSDLWGFKNYAMTRLLNSNEVKRFTSFPINSIPKGALYLELKHHPSLKNLKLAYDEYGRLRPTLSFSHSLLPLSENHLKKLFSHLNTARFSVKEGKIIRFGTPVSILDTFPYFPKIKDVPNGTYQFTDGVAYRVGWQGILSRLDENHPLYKFSPQLMQMWFNLGIEFDERFAPQSEQNSIYPSRYAYFRNNDLYLMGSAIIEKGDPLLLNFLEREKNHEQLSNGNFQPFVDYGPPLKQDGTIDTNFIYQYGIQVPEENYLVLGDNYAMSADSRDFGFVPQGNLRGVPDFIFWPPGSRWGMPNQPSFPFFTLGEIIAMGVFLLSVGGWSYFQYRRHQLPLKI